MFSTCQWKLGGRKAYVVLLSKRNVGCFGRWRRCKALQLRRDVLVDATRRLIAAPDCLELVDVTGGEVLPEWRGRREWRIGKEPLLHHRKQLTRSITREPPTLTALLQCASQAGRVTKESPVKPISRQESQGTWIVSPGIVPR